MLYNNGQQKFCRYLLINLLCKAVMLIQLYLMLCIRDWPVVLLQWQRFAIIRTKALVDNSNWPFVLIGEYLLYMLLLAIQKLYTAIR